MLMSWLRLPAWVWFLVVAPLFVATAGGRSVVWRAAPLVPLAVVVLFAYREDTHLSANRKYVGQLEVQWSPYQKVEYIHDPQQVAGKGIYVNGIAHQAMLPPSALAQKFYRIPHEDRARRGMKPYENVLIIGAGSGNDVATALAHGAKHVDAVEIDPVIADLGRRHHDASPYADPRVTLTIDDARAFMSRTTKKYDLVVFALTDSLVKVSSMAQLRLENYLFTVESFARAYSLTTASGDVVLYNYYRRPWLAHKFRQALHDASGKWPTMIHKDGDFEMMVVGRTRADGPAPLAEGSVNVPTDDWPFPYLQKRRIPSLYAGAMASAGGLIVLLALIVYITGRRRARATGEAGTGLLTKLIFLGMGVAFLLLETKSIVQFSLLFGTTWQNTSMVFLGVLLLVLGANWTATVPFFRRPAALYVVYALLLASCVVTLFFPLSKLLAVDSRVLRFVAAGAMTFSPIFFANLIFSITFRDEAVPEHVFGWNLLGATVGGVVEYSSMALGYNALALVVAACYTLVLGMMLLRKRATASVAKPDANASSDQAGLAA